MTDEEKQKDVQRLTAIERLLFPPLPDPPPADRYQKELEQTCVTLRAVADTLKLGGVRPNEEARFLAASARICSPFRALIICGAEHCRGIDAAIVAKRPSGNNLYWMGETSFIAGHPRVLSYEPGMNAERTITAGWHALEIVEEFFTRLEKASELYKNAAAATQSLTNPLVR